METASFERRSASLPLSLFASGEPALASSPRFERVELDPCCWVDLAPGFLVGADSLFGQVERELDWYRGRRLMYGTWYDEPRMSASHDLGASSTPSVVKAAAKHLGKRYGRRFSGLFCNYYQTGQDSVAWHADRIGRTKVDPLVAIMSLGGPRVFAMRDQRRSKNEATTKGRSRTGSGELEGRDARFRWEMRSGDLLVMGGATQHHWEHSVPKAKHAPPRISLTTRAG